MGALRVATLNLWGVFGDWPTRLTILSDTWGLVDADVVCLQEVCRDALTDQVAEVADTLGYPHRVCSWCITHEDGREEGVAIISRVRLERTEALLLPTSHPPRSLLSAHLAGIARAPVIATTHVVFHPDPVLEAQLARVGAHAIAHPRLILGADLNASPSRVARAIGHLGLHDAHAQSLTPTWPSIDPEQFAALWERRTGRALDFPLIPARLDHLLSHGLRARGSGIVTLRNDLGHASDHACLYADYPLGD